MFYKILLIIIISGVACDNYFVGTKLFGVAVDKLIVVICSIFIFPSYLPHKVGINETDEDRIVISFNIEISY